MNILLGGNIYRPLTYLCSIRMDTQIKNKNKYVELKKGLKLCFFAGLMRRYEVPPGEDALSPDNIFAR